MGMGVVEWGVLCCSKTSGIYQCLQISSAGVNRLDCCCQSWLRGGQRIQLFVVGQWFHSLLEQCGQ